MTGAEAALPAWADFMQAAIKRRPELGATNFECPEGIRFVEIDEDTGLISTLTCPHRELIAVTDRLAPHMECYFHGNLAQPYPEDERPSDAPAVKPRQPAKVFAAPHIAPSRGGTRVDVDDTGRRTLVTDMR